MTTSVIFAVKAVPGAYYRTIREPSHIVRCERVTQGRVVLAVNVPFYGWRPFGVDGSFLLRTLTNAELKTIGG